MKKIYFSIIILSAICMISCEDQFSNVVDYDLPEHESKLVSYCIIDVNSTEAILNLSKSVDINDDFPTNVENAEIQIYKDGNPFIDKFLLDSIFVGFDYEDPEKMDSLFAHIFSATVPQGLDKGSVYRLEVSSPGFPDISSKANIPGRTELRKAEFENDGYVDPEGYTSDELKIEFTDPINEENYYALSATFEYEFSDKSYSTGLYMSSIDPRINTSWNIPLLGEGYNQYIYFEDKEGFDGKDIILKFATDLYELDQQHENSRIKLVLYSISKDFYNFIHASQIYNENGSDFFAEPVVIPSNIQNGYGVFGFYDYDTLTISL